MPEKQSTNLSMDLDNERAYLKTQGRRDWKLPPSYFDLLMLEIRPFLSTQNLTMIILLGGQVARAQVCPGRVTSSGYNNAYQSRVSASSYVDEIPA